MNKTSLANLNKIKRSMPKKKNPIKFIEWALQNTFYK